MKKVLSMVLAIAMMTSMALAATYTLGVDAIDMVTGTSGTTMDDIEIAPGDTLRIYPDKFAGNSGNTFDKNDFDSEYFTITAKKITKGANLIASISINDKKGSIDIKFNQDYDLTASKKNVEIEELAVKTKKVINDGEGSNEIKKNKEFKVIENLSISVTQDKDTISLIKDQDVELLDSDLGKVITFEKAKVGGASYATLSVEMGDAYLEGRVYDGDEVYYGYDEETDNDILKAYPDAELRFLNINTNGFPTTMALELSADEDEYVYAVKDGKLVASGLKWDEDAYAWVGKVRSAVSYVISDIELDTAAVEPETPVTPENPETGANDVVGVATALAVVSLVAAGAVSLKK